MSSAAVVIGALRINIKTFTFANADANAGGSAIALPELCLGELKSEDSS